MKPGKIELQIKPFGGFGAERVKPIQYALPFFVSKNTNAKYVHRLRFANQFHNRDGSIHIAMGMWCGGHRFMRSGTLAATLPEGSVLCATCEGRAIGAGLVDSYHINGRLVRFQPRK